ncbi:MAG: hypothetical protein CMO74_04290 [Verrucomicrobiales bacterium]|nr:hypothetical protein [Verrucomicrobiales bacterium]|tara:strand:+ start:13589 stop:13813 length:225 start_codon:yes stop_codon:yes gene_type:complete
MRTLWLAPLLLAQTALALDEKDFQKLHRELQPDPKATWRTIPWKTSVLDAQAEAARTGKPIFIWAMDGHPLGCT